MKNTIKIAKYSQQDDGRFEKIGYDEYIVTYLKSNKIHELRVVVNGYLTKQKINIFNYQLGYKNTLLLAIKEFIENGANCKNIVTNYMKMSYFESVYSKHIVSNIKKYLLQINKEDSRDKLTELGFIF